jgi:hypothetical protein
VKAPENQKLLFPKHKCHRAEIIDATGSARLSLVNVAHDVFSTLRQQFASFANAF